MAKLTNHTWIDSNESPETENSTIVPLVIITGLSGAGKSTTMRVFEDLGYYCVDNLPPGAIPYFIDLYKQTNVTSSAGLAIASDVRSGDLFDDFADIVNALKKNNVQFEILYLDCANHFLINRFNEVRRSHPLQLSISINDAIEKERKKLEPIRAIATHIIDTSQLDVSKLRTEILRSVTNKDVASVLKIKFVSFGFKYGVPRDADFVFDVRFLPNPFYKTNLKSLTGEHADVYNFVMSHKNADDFAQTIILLLNITLESFINVGKFGLTVAIGCTGGRHRSVAFTKRLSTYYSQQGRNIVAIHRDIANFQL